MAGRLLFIALLLVGQVMYFSGCTRHQPQMGKVVPPAEISVSPPVTYPALPAGGKNLWQPEKSNFQSLRLENGIHVSLNTVSKAKTTRIRMVMPYRVSLEPAAAGLLSRYWLMGDTKIPEKTLLEQWHQLGNQHRFIHHDNRIIFQTRIHTDDLYKQFSLITRLMSQRNLTTRSIEQKWRRERVLTAANDMTALDLAKPFYKRMIWQDAAVPLTFSTDPEKLKSEYSGVIKDSFCPSELRLYIESDIPVIKLEQILHSTLSQIIPTTGCPQKEKNRKRTKKEHKPGTGGTGRDINNPVIYLLDKDGSQQVEILMGFPTIPRNHRDWEALTLLAGILGGGSGGRLFKDLRERQGLTYHVYSTHEVREKGSDLFIRMKTKPEKTGASLTSIFAHIQKLMDEPVFESEIQNALARRKGRMMRYLDKASGRLFLKSYSDRFKIPLKDLLEPSENLSPKRLRKVAGQYLKGPWLIVLTGDKKWMTPQLNKWLADYRIILIPAGKAMQYAGNQ